MGSDQGLHYLSEKIRCRYSLQHPDVVNSLFTQQVLWANVSSLFLEYSNITANTVGGIVLINIQGAEARYNRFVDNPNFAINAIALGAGQSLDATFNQWGTTETSALPVLGEVEITPILDSDLQEITTRSFQAPRLVSLQLQKYHSWAYE